MTKLQRLIEQCRRKQQQKPGQLEIFDDTADSLADRLMAIYCEQTDFMRFVWAYEIPWATEDEALAEWRSQTAPDWGFPSDWLEPA